MDTRELRWDGGDRLRDAIGVRMGWRGGVATFVRTLQEAEPTVPGSNRAMVQRYMAGKAAPSLGFLDAAARILNVDFTWLALGRGRPTDDPWPARCPTCGGSRDPCSEMN